MKDIKLTRFIYLSRTIKHLLHINAFIRIKIFHFSEIDFKSKVIFSILLNSSCFLGNLI